MLDRFCNECKGKGRHLQTHWVSYLRRKRRKPPANHWLPPAAPKQRSRRCFWALRGATLPSGLHDVPKTVMCFACNGNGRVLTTSGREVLRAGAGSVQHFLRYWMVEARPNQQLEAMRHLAKEAP